MLYQEEKGGIAITKFYNPCREVEENYRKATQGETATAETDGKIFVILVRPLSYVQTQNWDC